YGTAVSAIRGNHCDLRYSVGVQCAELEPCARSADSETENGKPGRAAKILRLVQSRICPWHEWLRASLRSSASKECACARSIGRHWGCWVVCWSQSAHQFRSRRRSGLLLFEPSTP